MFFKLHKQLQMNMQIYSVTSNNINDLLTNN